MRRRFSTMGLANKVFALMILLAILYIITLTFLDPAGKWRGRGIGDHDSDEHTNLLATDEMIVILGYKLHPDGMPTRILKDRVARAVALYKEKMAGGHHPLIIVSGKGKVEVGGHTEAEVMQELALCMDVRRGDVLVDPDSANTAQNAKFSSALIRNNKNTINEVYVVTSDYHMPRSQYIFQSVFPSDIHLEFVSAATSATKLRDESSREKSLMKSSQDDLIREGILATNDTYGYHPLRNLPRWRMIERELEQDIQSGKVPRNGKEVMMVDNGSNYGYFSLNLARKFPKGMVISLEGEAYGEYSGARKVHAKKMKKEDIHNNVLCRTTIIPRMFTKLYDRSQVYHYQLSLSVFHWIHGMPTREDFEEALAHHLLNSHTTFLELPEAMRYTSDTQHAHEKINEWYAGRNESQILDDVAAKYRFKMAYKFLGPILHENGTVRKVFRVDLAEMIPDVDADLVFSSIYRCRTLDTWKPQRP